MGYDNHGEMEIEEANEMNIPVCCFLSESEDGEGWEWTANNYMPRKNHVSEAQYKVTATTKEEILQAVKKYVVPLYQIAVEALATSGELYYWQKKD